jgi:hypothetical protein
MNGETRPSHILRYERDVTVSHYTRIGVTPSATGLVFRDSSRHRTRFGLESVSTQTRRAHRFVSNNIVYS